MNNKDDLQITQTTERGKTFINLENNLPGIRGLMQYSIETGKALNELAEILLHDDNNTLSRGEREMIGAYVSSQNDCFYCQNVHGALAQYYFDCNTQMIDDIKKDFASTSISPKLKALLSIAGSVQKGGKHVTSAQIEQAKKEGATDKEIHDTVLIAAAFCMFNRYVDGLNTWASKDRQEYIDRAPIRAKDGYANIDLNK
ncbi:MAG: carboxymuconolactone decarboxylase family protein [Bacteroidetes bacterium]|nr:carboxymuconolactone decarboxylase family protein [Bacteroidota bacterium]